MAASHRRILTGTNKAGKSVVVEEAQYDDDRAWKF